MVKNDIRMRHAKIIPDRPHVKEKYCPCQWSGKVTVIALYENAVAVHRLDIFVLGYNCDYPNDFEERY